jgi:hypothetical protein
MRGSVGRSVTHLGESGDGCEDLPDRRRPTPAAREVAAIVKTSPPPSPDRAAVLIGPAHAREAGRRCRHRTDAALRILHLIVLVARRCGGGALMHRPPTRHVPGGFLGPAMNMGSRWHTTGFEPLVRRGSSATLATSPVFAISGIVHDIVISVRARRIRPADALFPRPTSGPAVERTAPRERSSAGTAR